MASITKKLATASKLKVKISGHASVANTIEIDPDFPITRKSIATAASTISESGLAGSADDAIEAVKPGGRSMRAGARAGGEAEGIMVPEGAPSLAGLRDIGEASFGPRVTSGDARTESVLGADDRRQINNTGDLPWRMNASLLITARDGSSWIGTGWFVSPKVLITAGHCLYIRNSGVAGRDGWVQRITVIPGRNGNTMPFGQAVSTNFRSVVGWTQNGDPD